MTWMKSTSPWTAETSNELNYGMYLMAMEHRKQQYFAFAHWTGVEGTVHGIEDE